MPALVTAEPEQGLENLLMRLSALRGPLNDDCGVPTTSSPAGLGLVKNPTSVQLARYPGDGRGYVRHRDTPQSAQDSEEAERKVRICTDGVTMYRDLSPFSIILAGCFELVTRAPFR